MMTRQFKVIKMEYLETKNDYINIWNLIAKTNYTN